MRRCVVSLRTLSAVVAVLQPAFVTGEVPASPTASEFVTDGMPYAAFDELPASNLEVRGGTVEVAFAPGELELSQTEILEWIATSARAVTRYYGALPIRKVRVLVIPGAGTGVRGGTSYGYNGAAIKVTLGRYTTRADLNRDWVMTHEMVHLTFPSMPDAQNWIQEGTATYVEPIARAQIGQLSAEKVWGDMVKGLPQGLPKIGDRGLDRTSTWGRTYWGGALFCLLADIEIRQRTGNRKGLQDALRAIAAAGGTIETRSSLAYAFEIGDNATGVPALSELHERMKATAVHTNLAELWQSLGVEVRSGTVIFHDDAPLASVRRAIMKG